MAVDQRDPFRHVLLGLALHWLMPVAVAASMGQSNYGVQFDAGSSGTRVYVYEWSPRESTLDASPDPVVVEHADSVPKPSPSQVAFSMKVKPGISAYGTDPTLDPVDAGTGLADLFEFVRTTLASEGCDSTCQAGVPVFLGATAGMRVLPVETADTIMVSVGDAFASSGFRFDDPSWARIISGEEEGAFGWLAVNWLASTFSVGASGGGGAATIGALDLGGASTQITFTPSEEAILAGYFNVQVGESAVGVYTHSYLYFGRDQALEQQAAFLASSAAVVNPCFPVGSNDTSSEALPGISDAAGCLASTAAILTTVSGACLNADGTRCSLLGEYQPALGESELVSFLSSLSIIVPSLTLLLASWRISPPSSPSSPSSFSLPPCFSGC